jgi:hypothetical protein
MNGRAGVDTWGVDCLWLRFELTAEAPRLLAGWHSFVRDVCEGWPFRVVDIQTLKTIPVDEVPEAIKRDYRWEEFGRYFGWGR